MYRAVLSLFAFFLIQTIAVPDSSGKKCSDPSQLCVGLVTDVGVIDDTTQYLIDDWEDYLATHGKTPVQYTVPADPIEAAADIAVNNWVSSDLAVIAIDGSDYEDQVRQALKRTVTLKRETAVETIANDDPKIQNIGGSNGYPMFIGVKPL